MYANCREKQLERAAVTDNACIEQEALKDPFVHTLARYTANTSSNSVVLPLALGLGRGLAVAGCCEKKTICLQIDLQAPTPGRRRHWNFNLQTHRINADWGGWPGFDREAPIYKK